MTQTPPNTKSAVGGKTIAGAITGACMLIALPFTAHHEGLRTKAYLDPVGIPTICFGETLNVKLGQVKTAQECDDMLMVRLGYFSWEVHNAIKPEVLVNVRPETEAALSSFAYNVGVANFKSSTLLRKLNAGDIAGACNELPRWNRAKGIVLAGLVKRRAAERELCLKGLPNV